MSIEIDLTKMKQKFFYKGRRFELRKEYDLDSDVDNWRLDFCLFVNGRELDLRQILDADELYEYISLPYDEDLNMLGCADIPKEKLLSFIELTLDRYIESKRKSYLFINKG